MEINLEELMILQNALVNVKLFLSQDTKKEANKLKQQVDEAYQIIIKKIDRDPFEGVPRCQL